jgi:osmotically-inducible protein OsmY
MVRPVDTARGAIELRVENGVVTRAGEVPGLDYKRLAGLLAWWVPGSRDVINGLGVTPPEQDSDAAMTESPTRGVRESIASRATVLDRAAGACTWQRFGPRL